MARIRLRALFNPRPETDTDKIVYVKLEDAPRHSIEVHPDHCEVWLEYRVDTETLRKAATFKTLQEALAFIGNHLERKNKRRNDAYNRNRSRTLSDMFT